MVLFIFNKGQIEAKNTAQREAEGRTKGRRLNTKTSLKGEFELGKEPSPKGEVLEVKIRVRIRVMERMLIFLMLFIFLR